MRRYKTRFVVAIALVVGLLGTDALAAGERTRKSVASMGLQLINRTHPKVFRTGDFNYEPDILLGAAEGMAAISDDFPLNNDAQVMQAISAQIQLLRDAKEYGVSSYFAYRMGQLSALVTHSMLPFGMVWSPEEQSFHEQFLRDLDEKLDQFRYRAQERPRIFVVDVRDYFDGRRQFLNEDKLLIKSDYERGVGINGFLMESRQIYLQNAIIAVADVWHTVLRDRAERQMTSAHRGMLGRYFIGEIAYQLQVKSNMYRANQVYENFVTLNIDVPEAYEIIGDLYYEHGTSEAIDRALREWRIAHSIGGTDRRRVASKLSSHFMSEGRAYLTRAQEPVAEDSDLPNALSSFEQALEYDRFSDTAVDYIQRTHIAISERQQRFNMNSDIIASAERVREEGERARQEGSFSNAIQTFRQAVSLYNSVDDEFPVLLEQAERAVMELNRGVTAVITHVDDLASAAIDQGDRSRDDNNFDAAIREYERVPQILAAIPEDFNPRVTDNKNELLDMAEQKIDDARLARIRYEQAMQEQEAAAAAAGGQLQTPPQQQGPAIPGLGGQPGLPQPGVQQPGAFPGFPMPPAPGAGGGGGGLGIPGLSPAGQAAGGLAPL